MKAMAGREKEWLRHFLRNGLPVPGSSMCMFRGPTVSNFRRTTTLRSSWSDLELALLHSGLSLKTAKRSAHEEGTGCSLADNGATPIFYTKGNSHRGDVRATCQNSIWPFRETR